MTQDDRISPRAALVVWASTGLLGWSAIAGIISVVV